MEIRISESKSDLDRTNIHKHQFYKNINDNKEFEKNKFKITNQNY